MSSVLDPSEIEVLAKKVPEWEIEGGYLQRVFEFDEFMEGVDFVNSVAEIAEDAQHHPDIDIRYAVVTIYLTTHDVEGLTEADFKLAGRISTLVD